MVHLDSAEKHLGVSVAVSSLRSNSSIGVGDFNDLKILADWVAQSGLTIIQLLPINDTGSDPSPYMALSSQALHPLYLSINLLPGSSAFELSITEAKEKFNKKNLVDYHNIIEFKLTLAKKIFDANPSFLNDALMANWIKENPWVTSYAVFLHLKELNQQKSWTEWTTMQNATAADIEEYYQQHQPLFYVWLQYQLDQQLYEASSYLANKNIILKGDLPIMMNNDSVDVWQHRHLFNLDGVAGAPPDFFTIEGQRWGFPCYDWSVHAQDNFSWWRARLNRAERFFRAFRVDHILGFFRIWTIKKDDEKAALGYFSPSVALTASDFYKIGFNDERISWFSVPHIYMDEAKRALGDLYDVVSEKCFDQLEGEDLFIFKKEFTSDSVIADLPFPEVVKDALYKFYVDRALVSADGGYYVAWWYRRSKAYQSLNEDKKAFDELISQKNNESEVIWQKQAERLLTMMKNGSSMLICAEDLGAVPNCLPDVLSKLSILSLRVMRWARIGDGQEHVGDWINVADYPFLSVATLAVHDSSAIRGWWHEESAKEGMLQMLGLPLSMADEELTIENALALVSKFITNCTSALIILQLQDYFSLKEIYRLHDSNDERINYPGTVGNQNWSYRIPVTIEQLVADEEFILLIKNLKNLR